VNAVLNAYAIPALPAVFARDADTAAETARPMLADGTNVVVKILSRDIVHKSDVGGVRLNLGTPQETRKAAEDVIANARKLKPQARIDGVIVQPMVIRPKARELIAGIADDPTFGPVIVFGRGGTAVEIIDDKALALPPLDLNLAHGLIRRTRVSRILDRYRDVPAARRDDVALTLVKLAQLAADIPEIRELDINPLLADETGVFALDARIAIASEGGKSGRSRFALRPYPSEWERQLTLADGTAVFARPVRPEDEPLYKRFFARVSDEDLRLRFFAPVKDFNHAFTARLTQIDYARAMAFIALDPSSNEMLGAVRMHADANYETAEYAILLRSDLKGRGLGWSLMQLILEYARGEGLKRIHGQVLNENTTMLRMCRELGFDLKPDSDDCDLTLATYDLCDAAAPQAMCPTR
jgi:acetyltransferase